jgi:ubiquinone/menaquinone biosynthesis C-methylase UbiE
MHAMGTVDPTANQVEHAKGETSAWHAAYSNARLVARRSSSHKRKLERLGALDLPRNARVLDLCCGMGEALRILHAEGFTDLSGSDIHIDEGFANEPWAKLVASDACELPYSGGSFDAVVCMHSLHHLGGVVRIGRTFEECARVLAPGGRLMILDHYDSPQLRAVFWGLSKPWLTWPTAGLRNFRLQHEEEWPYMYEYLDAFPAVPAMLRSLRFDVRVERRGAFFYYWAGVKPL